MVALDEFDLEAAALIREDLRLPGMGQTTTRHFRDKLAMRVAAQRAGVAVPEFVAAVNHDDLRHFMETVPGPWLLKPRTSASAIGIRTVHTPADLWRNLEELRDGCRRFCDGAFCARRRVSRGFDYVGSGSVQHQAVHQYGAPPMRLMQHGGVFTTRTVPRLSEAARELCALDGALVPALGMVSGVTHSEYIFCEGREPLLLSGDGGTRGRCVHRGADRVFDGAEPVGGVGEDRVRAAAASRLYGTCDAAGVCGVRDLPGAAGASDLSGYTAPEIVWEMEKDHHAGLIVQAGSADRVRALTEEYAVRFAEDFCATLPPPEKPTS